VAAATSHEKTLGKPTTQKAEIRPREREKTLTISSHRRSSKVTQVVV
jgi:hypothetical protein